MRNGLMDITQNHLDKLLRQHRSSTALKKQSIT